MVEQRATQECQSKSTDLGGGWQKRNIYSLALVREFEFGATTNKFPYTRINNEGV